MMSGGMVFHSPSFRYCHWSERSSPTLKRVLNTSPLSQQDFQGTPRRSRAAGVISCALNHSWCRHRRIVSVSTKREQKKNAEYQRYAVERFHGSLRYGLSFILASANHTNSPATEDGHILKKKHLNF